MVEGLHWRLGLPYKSERLVFAAQRRLMGSVVSLTLPLLHYVFCFRNSNLLMAYLIIGQRNKVTVSEVSSFVGNPVAAHKSSIIHNKMQGDLNRRRGR